MYSESNIIRYNNVSNFNFQLTQFLNHQALASIKPNRSLSNVQPDKWSGSLGRSMATVPQTCAVTNQETVLRMRKRHCSETHAQERNPAVLTYPVVTLDGWCQHVRKCPVTSKSTTNAYQVNSRFDLRLYTYIFTNLTVKRLMYYCTVLKLWCKIWVYLV